MTTPSVCSPRSRLNSSSCTSRESPSFKLGLSLQSLSAKIAESIDSSDRLEAAHRSHTTHGFHIEDAGGAELPSGPVMAAAPRSTVLLVCGAMRGTTPDCYSHGHSQFELETRGRR